MKKTMYKWIVLNEYNEIVSYGFEDTTIEMNIEKIHMKIDYCSYRNMSDMQDFLDEYFPALKLNFYYKEIEVDFSECLEVYKE